MIIINEVENIKEIKENLILNVHKYYSSHLSYLEVTGQTNDISDIYINISTGTLQDGKFKVNVVDQYTVSEKNTLKNGRFLRYGIRPNEHSFEGINLDDIYFIFQKMEKKFVEKTTNRLYHEESCLCNSCNFAMLVYITRFGECNKFDKFGFEVKSREYLQLKHKVEVKNNGRLALFAKGLNKKTKKKVVNLDNISNRLYSVFSS